MSEFRLSDVIERAINIKLDDVHTAIPGKITSYDKKKKKASVKPEIRRAFSNGQILPIKVISNVPVVIPYGGKFKMKLPIQKGDGCLILFSEASLERWLSCAGEVNPGDNRRFDLSDAICIPGLDCFDSPDYDTNPNNDFELEYFVSNILSAKLKLTEDGKVGLGNSTGEIFDLLSQLVSILITATTGTGLIVPTNPTAFADLKAKLDLIKATL